jgi:hypothetical protein
MNGSRLSGIVRPYAASRAKRTTEVKATKDIPDGCDEDVLLKPLPLWAPHSHDPVGPTPGPVVPGAATRLGPMPRKCGLALS